MDNSLKFAGYGRPLLGNYRGRRPRLFSLSICDLHFRQVIELHVG
jgi:hypothetical protein